ncbi:MAG: GntR family transcriptional regulator [Tissierellaceae bacterium]
MVTYYPRKGSIVSKISIEDAFELYQVREVLEGLATKLICININRPSLEVLKDIVARMDQAVKKNDHEAMKSLHQEWGQTTLSLTPNKRLKSYLTSTMENLERLRKISLFMPEQSLDAYNETKDILKAIVDNKPEESEKLARLHVRNAKKRFEKNMSKVEKY